MVEFLRALIFIDLIVRSKIWASRQQRQSEARAKS